MNVKNNIESIKPFIPFIPARIPRGSKILIHGKCRTGKTTLLKNLIKRRNLRNGTIVTNNPEEWSLDKSVNLLTARSNMKLFNKQINDYNETGCNTFFAVDENAELVQEIGKKIRTQHRPVDLFLVTQEAPFLPTFDYWFIAGQTDLKQCLGENYYHLNTITSFGQSTIQDTLNDLSPYEFLVLGALGTKTPPKLYKAIISY